MYFELANLKSLIPTHGLFRHADSAFAVVIKYLKLVLSCFKVLLLFSLCFVAVINIPTLYFKIVTIHFVQL